MYFGNYITNNQNCEIIPLDESAWVVQNSNSITPNIQVSTSNGLNESNEKENNTQNPEYATLLPDEISLYESSIVKSCGDSPLQCPESAIMKLRQIQKHLVASVWYGKVSPYGDIPVRILDGLYLGSSHTSTRKLVEEYDIGMLLRLGWGFVNHFRPGEVLYEDYRIQDSMRAATALQSQLHEMVDKIHKSIKDGVDVLVHCYAGVSRSGTVVLAYLMKYHQMNLLQAFEFVYKVCFCNSFSRFVL